MDGLYRLQTGYNPIDKYSSNTRRIFEHIMYYVNLILNNIPIELSCVRLYKYSNEINTLNIWEFYLNNYHQSMKYYSKQSNP